MCSNHDLGYYMNQSRINLKHKNMKDCVFLVSLINIILLVKSIIKNKFSKINFECTLKTTQ